MRYFDDASAVELEQAKGHERQLRLKISQVRKETGLLKKACAQVDECKAQELQELKDMLFDVTSDGRSRVNLQKSRLRSLEEELDQMKAQLKDGEIQLKQLQKDRVELAELKALQNEVQQRNAQNAQIIEQQNQQN